MHVLVGDGISSNEAAAKIVLPWALRDFPTLEYLIMVVKCASHQANLAIGAAVTCVHAVVAAGQGNSVAARPDAITARKQEGVAGQPHRTVCGVVVRLFKYLINQYYEEFVSSLRTHATRLVFLQGPPSALALAETAKWSRMAELYGESVIPARLLLCLNNGLRSWSHTTSAVAPDHAAPAPGGAAQPPVSEVDVRGVLVEVLRKRLLSVDEKPTLSRFFTFREHIQGLLLLSWVLLPRSSS